jgi:nicotinamide phosphoribosyltransferase
MTRINPILDTDSYKLSHFLGYPQGAEHVYSYAESRGGIYPATVFFGLQKFVKELAATRVTVGDVFEAAAFAKAHGEPFNEAGWMHIVDHHGGRIPVIIKAVPEGTLVPTRNVLVTVENTDPKLPWLTSYIETALLRACWYPTTVATRIFGMKQRIKSFYDSTSDIGDMGFSVLDFSARGCSSRETAEIGGMAHLLSFIGSDNIPAVLAASRYYDEPMAAFSVAATEHSVMTGFGQNNEEASIDYLIENMMPENGILSVVGDTWNIYNFVKIVARKQEKIANKGGTLVIRPDSGKMRNVLPTIFTDVRDLFWATTNSKGYRIPKYVKVLQGDGINENTVTQPFAIAKEKGISADAVMTGSGGGLMQSNIDRDTCKFAFKASNITINGVDHAIAKNPITDRGKMSKKGRMILLETGMGDITTVTNQDPDYGQYEAFDCLQTVYDNGAIYNMENLATIRKRLNKYL